MTDFAKLIMGADTRGLKEALLDLANLSKGSEKTENSVISLNKGLLALGAAGGAVATVLAVGVKHAINTADEYSKLSQRLGIAVKDLGALAHAADLSGVSLESVAMGVQFLSRNMATSLDSATGSAAQSFKSLGIVVTDTNGNLRDSQDVLNDLADRFANMPDGAQKTAAAMDLVGRGGAALIPLLNGGSKAMEDMRKEAEALHLVISKETAKAAEDFNDNLTRLGRGLTGVFNIIAAQVLPSLVSMSEQLVVLTKDGLKFFSENLGTLTTVLDHALIAATSLAVFMAGKFAVSLAVTAVGAITSTLGSMIALEMALGATSRTAALSSIAIKLFSAALTGLKGALIATGIGLLIVGAGELVALLISLKTATGSWGQAFALVGGVLKGVFMDAWQGMKTLVSGAGAAFKGLWEAIKAGVTGGDISGAFLAEFDKIKFGTSATMEAVAKLNAALHPENPMAAPSGTGAPTPQPAPGPSQEVLDAYNKLVKSLTEQATVLGMTDRAAAMYTATTQLAEGSTAAMKERVSELAGALFDSSAKHDAAKATADSYKTTVDELTKSIEDQFATLYKTDAQIEIDNALRKVSGKLTDDQIKKITALAKTDAALKKGIEDRNKLEKAAAELKLTLMTKQEKLNEKLKEYGELLAGGFINQAQFDKAIAKAKKDIGIDTRSIGEKMWDGLKATFFDPFSDGAKDMGDKFAQQVDRMSQAADRMSKGKSTVDKIQGGLDVLSNIPGPIGAYAGMVSKAISVVKSIIGIVKSVKTALFGGKFETTGGGLQLQLGAQGVMGQSFEDQHKAGGLFSGSKDRTIFSGVSATQQTQFNAAYGAILDNATKAFGMFGIEASRNIMSQVQLAALNIKTSGEGALSESAAAAAIQDWFKQLDSAVVNAVGGADIKALLDLATDGEAATETLMRLGNQMNITNALLDSVNLSMYDAGISGAVMADSLVKMAGGMDKFQAGVDAFFKYFFTEDEQMAKLTENLTNTFTALGLTLPTTRAGVRALVSGLDLTTEAGQRAFAAITGSSEALNTYYTSLEASAAATAAAAANIGNVTVALTDAEKAAAAAADAITKTIHDHSDAALGALKQSIDAEKAAKQTAHNDAIAQIQKEGQERTKAANLVLAAARQTLSALQSEVNGINGALANAQAQLDPVGTQRSAVAFLKAALQSGHLTGTGAAAQRATQLSVSNFASAADFRREQIKTLNLLSQLSDTGETQINYAELTVTRIEDEIVAIQASTAELIDVENILFNRQIATLDGQLATAENQLNELRGIHTGILSVDTALRDFTTAISAERANNPPAGVTTGAAANTATSDATVRTLERIASYSQSTAVATTKSFNLDDRQWREAQAALPA